MSVFAELSSTKRLRSAEIIAIFSEFFSLEITPENAPAKCRKEAKMWDFPHDCRTVDTYAFISYYR